MKKKIFGIALLGVLSTLNAGVISQNGVAKDSATGLMWQDDNDAKTIEKDWEGAKAYCENFTLGGYSDWRLPNIYELTTLLDNTKSSKPYVIDGIENIVSSYYWSSTTRASSSSDAGVVIFHTGSDDWGDKTHGIYVRCVRAGQLNFDNLVILNNQGKVKVNQKNIDMISPKAEEKRIKEAEIAKKQKAQERSSSVNTRSQRVTVTYFNEHFVKASYGGTQNYNFGCSDGTYGSAYETEIGKNYMGSICVNSSKLSTCKPKNSWTLALAAQAACDGN